MKLFGRGNNGAAGRNRPAAPAGGPAVLFPGPEGWEIWSGTPERPVCAGPVEKPRQLRPTAGCVLSLPTRSFFSLPLWVPMVEDSPAREQTQIRLEMKGMLGANPDVAVWNFEPIRKEEIPAVGEGEPINRQLEATAVLAVPFHEDWLVEEAARYEPAGRLLPAPGSGAWGVLRRELGRWVADFYQAGKWVHAQALLSPALDGVAAVELNATLAQLEGEGVFSGLEGWLVREAGALLTDDFRKNLRAPIRLEERMPPWASRAVWNLPPPALTELRAGRAQRQQRAKLIRTGLMAYGAVMVFGVALLAWPWVRLLTARAELAKIGPEAESIRATAMLWRDASAWLDPRRNALELLWQVSRPLIETEPPKIEGVRLTLFDLNAKRLLLQGEGKDLELVEKYLQWLKNEPALAGITWKNPQPRLLPNGNAQFQAEGIPPGVAAEAEEGGPGENPDAP